jgi:hypothetical protein
MQVNIEKRGIKMLDVKNRFLNEVVNCLKEENEQRERHLKIPFLIAPLANAVDKKEFKCFLNDLVNYEDYVIYYEKDTTGGYTNGSILIYLRKCADIESPNFNYKIEFGLEERNWGYCECSEDDKDYRADKGCCGHGCDWTAPTIVLYKVETIFDYQYMGYEHDYWDFEDKFYLLETEVRAKKELREKEDRITYLKETINKMKMELAELA